MEGRMEDSELGNELSAELKTVSRRLMVDNAPGLFFVVFVFVAIAALILNLQLHLPGTTAAYSQYMGRISGGELHGFSLFISLLAPAGLAMVLPLFLLTGVFRVGLRSYYLRISRRLDGRCKNLSDGFSVLLKVLQISIISGVLIILWSILLVFPGILAFYRYRQSYYILLDDPSKGALQCIRESTLLMRGSKLDLFLIDMSFLGWHMLSISLTTLLLFFLPLLLPVAWLLISPYKGLCHAAFYGHLLIKQAT